MSKIEKQRSMGIQRHRVSRERDCSLGVIAFNSLNLSDYQAKIVDLSVIGIGIESPEPIQPGIVWFKKCVSGQNYGSVVWCRPMAGGLYRAGIQFLTLSREEEEYLRRQFEQGRPNSPVADPDQLIARLIEDIKADSENSPGSAALKRENPA